MEVADENWVSAVSRMRRCVVICTIVLSALDIAADDGLLDVRVKK